jgi:small subunit ribosomal protein S4
MSQTFLQCKFVQVTLLQFVRKQKKQTRIQESLGLVAQSADVSWVNVDATKLEGTFKQAPDREDIGGDINESLIVELYSR